MQRVLCLILLTVYFFFSAAAIFPINTVCHQQGKGTKPMTLCDELGAMSTPARL